MCMKNVSKSEGHNSKTCLKQPLSKRPKIDFRDQLSLNEGQKYCRMLQESGVAKMAWDVMSGVTKTAWDVMSGVTKTAWDVLFGVANLCEMFGLGVKNGMGCFVPGSFVRLPPPNCCLHLTWSKEDSFYYK